MKNRINHIARCLCGAAVLSVLLLPRPAAATILTFTIDDRFGNPSDSLETVFPNYGDNVTSTNMLDGGFTYSYGQGNAFTPNISLSYSDSLGGIPANWQLMAYRDSIWPSVAYLPGGAGVSYYYTFTPDSGVAVQVNSFDVFGYTASLSQSIQWFLHQDTVSGTVFDSGSTSAGLSYGSPVLVTTAGSSYQGTVVLEILHDTGNLGELGMDNLNFDQVVAVPEPSTVALLAAAGAFWLLKRTRHV